MRIYFLFSSYSVELKEFLRIPCIYLKSKFQDICQILIKFSEEERRKESSGLVSVRAPLDVSFAQFL